MFTGIVTDVGQVRHIEKRGDTHIVIATQYDVSTDRSGRLDRVFGRLHDGGRQGQRRGSLVRGHGLRRNPVENDAGQIGRSAIRSISNGPMKIGDELGGHIVTGHVDGVAEVVSVAPEGESVRMSASRRRSIWRASSRPRDRWRWTASR